MAQFIDFEVGVEADAEENDEVSEYDSIQILYRLSLTITKMITMLVFIKHLVMLKLILMKL